jgi:hypothetical protein
MTEAVATSDAHETANQVYSAVDRTQDHQSRSHAPALARIDILDAVSYLDLQLSVPAYRVLCLAERTTAFSSSEGSLMQAILQGHIHSLARNMSISPFHDLIFNPIDLICRTDHIIQKVTTLLDTQ